MTDSQSASALQFSECKSRQDSGPPVPETKPPNGSGGRFCRVQRLWNSPTLLDGFGLLLITFAFFWKVVSRLQVGLFIEDLQTIWGVHYYFISQLRQGIFPLWDMFTWSGAIPIYARAGFGLTYPLHWLFDALSLTATTLPGSAKWIVDYNIVCHHFLAAFFTYLFCRFGLRLDRLAAIAAGVVWSFSGFFVAHLTHPMFAASSIYLPLMLLFFERYVERRSAADAALSGVFLGVCLLGAYTQIAAYVFGFAVFYALWVFAVEWRVSLKNLIVFLGLFSLIGGGLSLVQYLPAAELMKLSERNQGLWGTYTFAAYGHLVPKDLIMFLAPYRASPHWNERLVYLGAVSLVVILLGLFRVERKRRYLFPLLFMIPCFLLMMGPGYGVSYLFFKCVPIIGAIHHQVRCAVVFNFSAALLVGLTLDALRSASLPVGGSGGGAPASVTPARRQIPLRRLFGVALFLGLAIILIAVLLAGSFGPWPALRTWFKADLVQAFLFLIASAAVAIWGLSGVRSSSTAALALAVLATMDLYLFNVKSPWRSRPGNAWVSGYAIVDHRAAFETIRRGERCRVENLSNSAWPIRLQTINGYPNYNMISAYSRLYSMFAGRRNTLFYDLLNVRYLLLQARPPDAVDAIASSYYVGHPGEHAIDRNLTTEWVEAVLPYSYGDREVTGDWMVLTFSEPVMVARIALVPRAAKPVTLIRRLKLEFQDGATTDIVLRDEGDLQTASFAPQRTSTVKLTITGTDKVTSPDVGFREIYLYDQAGSDLVAAAKNTKYRQAIEPGCYENLHVFPRAWLVGEFRVAEPNNILDAILRKSFDPRRTALLEQAPKAFSNDAAPLEDTSATIERYEPNRIAVRCRTSRAAILVLSEVFYPGWKARIGRTSAPIYRADYTLRAVVVPAGENVVEFHYSPLSFNLGLAGSSLTLLAAILLIFASRRRRLRPPTERATLPGAS